MEELKLCYPVILRPSDVKFTVKTIPTKFDNGNRLVDVLEEMKAGRILPKEIPPIQVIWYCERWEWYTINNRRLWLFQQLEKLEEIKYASMNRVEVMHVDYDYPTYLYAEVVLYDPPWDIKTNAILNNRLSSHAAKYNSGKCSPTRSDGSDIEDVEMIDGTVSVISIKSTASTRPRTTSSGTTVADDFDDRMEETMSIENDDVTLVEVKNEPFSPKRSRSRTRRTRSKSRGRRVSRSPIKRSRSRKYSKKRSNSRSASIKRSSSRSRQDYRSKSVMSSKGYRSKSVMSSSNVEDVKNDPWALKRRHSYNRSRSREDSSKGVSRYTRSKSVMSSSNVKDETDDPWALKRRHSYTKSRSREDSSKSVSRYTRSKSVMNFPVKTDCKDVMHYNSLYAENARYRNRTRSKSVASFRTESKESVNDWSVSRKRSSSICSHLSRRSDSDVWSFDSRRTRSSSVCTHRSVKSTASSLNYQLDKFSHEKAPRYQRPTRNKFIENDFTTDYKYSSSRALVKGSSYADSLSSGYGSGTLMVKRGIQLSDLYSLWAKRRAEFLQARRSGQLHLMYGPEEGYLCGLCFKKFRQVVDLQQHSEELLHYACITCGRFFNTYTALGQHCSALLHTKD